MQKFTLTRKCAAGHGLLGRSVPACQSEAASALRSYLPVIVFEVLHEVVPKPTVKFEAQLSAAAAKLTSKQPDAAIDARHSWLADSIAGTRGGFVDGVIEALREVAHQDPLRLVVLRSHPDMTSEIFRLEPSFATTSL